jgi:hypothetical protein
MEPEWLDELPAADPRAMRSRRDLNRVNTWMRQVSIMARLLIRHSRRKPPLRIVDLGTGDGAFTLRVVEAIAPHWPVASIALIDRQNIVGRETLDGFRALGWRAEAISADALDYLEHERVSGALVTANLFLHHLSDDQLRRLFAAASSADMVAACEPRRNAFALLGSRLLFFIGANDVSRHDAVASVRAGFAGRELSGLWPGADEWRLRERLAMPFTHTFLARRAHP